jgi:hypothetical protein
MSRTYLRESMKFIEQIGMKLIITYWNSEYISISELHLNC